MKNLRIKISKEMSNIPNWINTTKTLHHQLWNNMLDCNDILMVLIWDKILKEKSIINIAQKFDEKIVETLSIDNKLHLEIAIYYTSVIDMIEELCVEEEEFEAAANITKFRDIYFQNMTYYQINESNKETN